MHIHYTMFGTRLTGGVRVLLEIADRLVKRGNNVTITALGQKGDHKWFPSELNVNYVQKNVIKKYFVSGIRHAFKKELGKKHYPHPEIKQLFERIPDCDINVATFCLTAFSVFRSGKGIPFYHMQHYEPFFFNDPFLQKISEESYYLPLNRIANSTWLKNQMKERFGYDLPVVCPAIDHNVFYPRDNDMKNDTKKLKVLCFGKQTRWKGFPEALEAMKIVMKKRNDVEFFSYGMKKPSYGTDISYNFIKAPSDEELAKLYSSADAVICPSWYESFPLFPIEAMACGAPIVTTPYGVEDYAIHEKNSLVVPPKSPKMLASAILRLLEDENLREQFRKQGQITAKQFTWDKTVDAVEKLFKGAQKGI